MRAIFIFLFFVPFWVSAQEVHQDLEEILKLEIVAVVSEEDREIYGTDTVVLVQTLEGKILSGDRKGEIVTFENEINALKVGDRGYVNYIKTINGDEYYVFKDFLRINYLLLLGVLFITILILFSGWQGARAVVSLLISVGAIFYILIPMLLSGTNAALSSLLVAGIVLAAILFITHNVNARSVIAFCGTFSAVLITCVVAWLWVTLMRFTGMSTDESIYLNFSTNGNLDFTGLLLGGIIIGILGVLDDVSITQASIVQELKAANKSLNFSELYKRGIRVGRDHVGSLVNTLAFAYVGVSLPLILLFANAKADLLLSLNQEVISVEITRIIIGSIGLIMAVPLTTVIAAWWFASHDVDEKCISSHSHTHSH